MSFIAPDGHKVIGTCGECGGPVITSETPTYPPREWCARCKRLTIERPLDYGPGHQVKGKPC